MAYLHEPSGSCSFGSETGQSPKDMQCLNRPIDCFAWLIETPPDIDHLGAVMLSEIMQAAPAALAVCESRAHRIANRERRPDPCQSRLLHGTSVSIVW